MPQAISEEHGLFASIRDAIRGDSHRDFTKEPIGRAITLLAIPMVLEMMMESLFAVVDMFWVAHLGSDAVATVGLTEAVLDAVLRGRHGTERRHHGDGRPPHRREESGGRGRSRDTSRFCWAC